MAIKLTIIKCLRCGYTWAPRFPVVLRCANPECRTVYWNIPKRKRGESESANKAED
jgi:hypothetical protein